MKALILAAGYATRLYPLTLNKPKPLLFVGSKTITDRLIEKLEKIGDIDRIYIVTNQKFASKFEDWIQRASYKKDISIINDGTLTNETRLGAIGDIKFVIEREKIDDDMLILGGDNLFEFNLGSFVKFAESKEGFSIALRDVKDLKEAKKYGIVSVDAQNRITEFVEKPKRPESTLAAMCIYYFPKEKLRLINTYLKTGKDKDAPGHYISWLVENDSVYGYKLEGEWFDIGDKRLLKLADKAYTEREGRKRRC